MEYYSDFGIPTEHLLTDSYAPEYTAQYLAPSHESEYSCRSTVLVDGGDRFGVSAVTFDKQEELIWMGNQGGHVTSYYGPNMQKYTSFQVHDSEEVRDIITADTGIYALTKTTLRHQIRRGIPKHTFRSPHMTDMQCLYQESPTKLLIGGHQDKLIELDLTMMAERIFSIQEESCAVLRSGGGSLVACGSANGTVALRDSRTPGNSEHTFQAHTACLSDLDMQGDLLITCGFTDSVNTGAVAEPYIVVWDVRYLRGSKVGNDGAWSIPTASPPLLLHFVPAFSGKAIAVSDNGHVTLLNVNSTESGHSVFQIETNSSSCRVMDVAATSQAFAFGDQSGHLHLFAPQHNHDPVFNNFSRATEFAGPAPNLPFVSITDETFQFSSVKLPPLNGTKWFNVLPPEFYKTVPRKPKPIDPEVLKTMKMQGPIGYAPNPKTHRRNEMPYIEDKFEDLMLAKNDLSMSSQPIPKHYQKTEVRYKKQGVIDLAELRHLNKTGYPGLEATVPNSYCNPMLQVLYYTPPVKATLLAHSCAKEFCLSCELGFLFRMLDTANGAPCQAGNFLRAFRTVPEAAALGLILPERGPDPRVDLVAIIQSWNRFILHQIHSEIVDTKKKDLAVLNSSPPKLARAGKNVKNSMATPTMNGFHREDYKYSKLEFPGPSTQFERVRPDGAEFVEGRDDRWPTSTAVERGVADSNHIQNNDGANLTVFTNHSSDCEDSEISKLFAIGRHQLNKCLKCNKEEERKSVALACALQYPTGSRDGEPKGSFVELVGASLAGGRSTAAWCENCARFTPTTQRGRIVRLPPILAINCGGVAAHEKAYWSKSSQKDVLDSRRSSNKPCRYALHCARPGCRFKHPDRPGSSQSNASKSPSHESHCVLPLQLVIRLQDNGDVIINDKSDQSPIESPRHESTSSKSKKTVPDTEEEYSLSAAVVCVEDNPKHLVAYVQPATVNGEWYMVNDLSVVQVPPQEVVHFGAWWKSPCVLFYSTDSARQCAVTS